MKEVLGQMWSTRTLSRNVGTLYYDRRMASIMDVPENAKTGT